MEAKPDTKSLITCGLFTLAMFAVLFVLLYLLFAGYGTLLWAYVLGSPAAQAAIVSVVVTAAILTWLMGRAQANKRQE